MNGSEKVVKRLWNYCQSDEKRFNHEGHEEVTKDTKCEI